MPRKSSRTNPAIQHQTQARSGKEAEVLIESNLGIPLVDFQIIFRGGSLVDPVGREGEARLAARVLRMGTRNLTMRAIDERVDALGGSLGADTSATMVRFSGTVIRRNFEPMMRLVGELLTEPAFRPRDLAQAKREAYAALAESLDDDRGLAQRAFRQSVFRGHPYSRRSFGSRKSIETVTVAGLRAVHARTITRDNVMFAFSGAITRRELDREAMPHLSFPSAKGAPPRIDVPEAAPLDRMRVIVVDKPERTQTQIFIGGLGTHARDADHHALIVGNTIFGGTFTSRLTREVRSVRGWSYGASSRLSIDRVREAWQMWTFPSAKDAVPCIDLQLGLVQKLVRDGVTKKEVAFAQSFISKGHAFEVDTALKRLDQRVEQRLLELPRNYFPTYVDRIRAVTVDEVNAALRKRIEPRNLVIALVATADEVVPSLEKMLGAPVEVVPHDRD